MGYCWGGFALPFYFSWANNIALGCIFNGILMSIWLGRHGHEAAWQNRHFRSFGEFQETMRAWDRWGKVHVICSGAVLLMCLVFVAGSLWVFGGKAFEPVDEAAALDQNCFENVRKIALACEIYGYDCDGRLPQAGNWRQSVGALCPGHQIPKCLAGGTYSYNRNVAGKKASVLPASTVIVYEGDAKGLLAFPHGGRSNVACPKGTASVLRADGLTTVEWQGKPPERAPVASGPPKTVNRRKP
jgi:hypothetical protein